MQHLKTYSDGGLSVWGDGFEEDEYYGVIKSAPNVGNSFKLTLDDTYEPNETYIKQYKTSAAVAIKAFPGTAWADSNSLMCAGLAEDLSPEAVAGNNAMQAFQGTAWKVHNDCNEVIYLKLARSDLSLHMYIGGYEEAHVLTIGGQTVNLTKFDEEQYSATGVTLSAGDTVTSYTIEGVAQTVTSKEVSNNNLSEDMKVFVDTVANIYYDINAKTLFVSGLPNNGHHILKNGHELVFMTPTEDYDGFKQYKSGYESFAVNDTIEFIDVSGAGSSRAVVWQLNKINAAGLGSNFAVDGEKIKCVTACSTYVYLKLKTDLNEVYFGDVPEDVAEAIKYTQTFKNLLALSCADTEHKQEAVHNNWVALGITYASLSGEAKTELGRGGYSDYPEIREFAERYIAIMQQHSDWDLTNFMGWIIPPVGSTYGNLSNQNYNAFSLNTLVIIIGVVSAITLTGLMIVKRRKHD